MFNQILIDFKYYERVVTVWLKKRKVFAIMKRANVIVTNTQCLDVETKRGSTVRKKFPSVIDIHHHNLQ